MAKRQQSQAPTQLQVSEVSEGSFYQILIPAGRFGETLQPLDEGAIFVVTQMTTKRIKFRKVDPENFNIIFPELDHKQVRIQKWRFVEVTQ